MTEPPHRSGQDHDGLLHRPDEETTTARLKLDLIESALLWEERGDTDPTMRGAVDARMYRDWCYARARRLREHAALLPE